MKETWITAGAAGMAVGGKVARVPSQWGGHGMRGNPEDL